MGTRYWFQVALLIGSFVLVVWAIKSIRERGVGSHVEQVLAGTGGAGAPEKHTRVDLCETRVSALKLASGIELYESGLSWMLKKNSTERRLDPVSVEKWFGHNCSVEAEDLREVASNEIQAAHPVLTIDFIHGASEAIRQTASGSFIWKKIAFHSQQLESALKELPKLQDAGPNGRAGPLRHED